MSKQGSTRPNQASRIDGAPTWPMSAYSASAPVIVKTTAPIAMKAIAGRSMENRIAQCGDKAVMMTGWWMIHGMPKAARVRNQVAITGPKALPMTSVPRLCTMNKRVRMTTEAGRTIFSASGLATVRPSTALITEIAGVIKESP